jgi:hypothetical protein
MTSEERFDCVEYKRAVQARHAAECGTLSPDQKRERRTQWLRESENPAARLWRELNKKLKATVSSR